MAKIFFPSSSKIGIHFKIGHRTDNFIKTASQGIHSQMFGVDRIPYQIGIFYRPFSTLATED